MSTTTATARSPWLRGALAATVAAAALGAAAAPAPAQSTPRVVALEWDALQSLVALGVTPVGAAGLDEYSTWVSTPLPRGIASVGTRQEPSLVAIARLRPTLIVVPRWRATQNLGQLRRIARVIVTDPYAPGSGAVRFSRSLKEFRTLAAAVGRRAQGERLITQMNRTFATQRARLATARRGGASIILTQPGGTTSAPQLRIFTQNSAPTEALRRLGLRNGWTAKGAPAYGFTVQPIEGLRPVQRAWLAFVYPHTVKRQVESLRRDAVFARLDLARKNRVRTLNGRTWLYGGPVAWTYFAREMGTRFSS